MLNKFLTQKKKFLQGNLVVNPFLFLEEIKNDFSRYIFELQNEMNKESREKFEKFWESCGGFSFD